MLAFRMIVVTALRQGGLLAATLILLSQLSVAAPILADFNLVVGGNLVSSSEVEGRALVGGGLSGPASNYGVRLTPSAAFSDVDTLIVGGNITATNVNVSAGDVRVGGTASGIVNLNGSGSDLVQNDPTVSGVITSVLAQLHSLSAYFAGLSPNSTITNPPGPSAVTFNAAAGPGNMAVLNVDSALFSDPQSQQYDLNIDPGVDLMIVNVVGTTVNFTQGNFTGVFSDPVIWPHLIWNFVDADSINLQRAWFGSIIAPHANLTSSTSIDGSVFIGGDFDQRGEVHLPLFRGNVPQSPVPEPATVGLISTSLLAIALWKRKSVKRSRI